MNIIKSAKLKQRFSAFLTAVLAISSLGSAFVVNVPVAQAAGTVAWTAGGVLAGPTTNQGFVPHGEYAEKNVSTSGPVVETSDGYYVYTWYDATDDAVYAQKIDATGALQWGSSGVTVATGTLSYPGPIVADSSGNVIVVFGYYDGSDINLYAQKLNSSGATQWTSGGLPVANVSGKDMVHPTAIPDGSGGIIVAYTYDYNAGTDDIYAQRLNGSGAKQWTSTGVAISAATDVQWYPVIVTDGSGGAIIGWQDARNGATNFDIYAQRVNSSGAVQWTANGVVVSAASRNQHEMTSAVADGSGGAVFSWSDDRGNAGPANTGPDDVYVQLIDSSGSQAWTANGVSAITSGIYEVSTSKVAMSGSDVMVVAQGDDGNLFLQKFNPSGVAQFAAGGIQLTTGTNTPHFPTQMLAAGDGSGDVLIVDEVDIANISGRRVRVLRVDSSGTELYASSNGTDVLDYDSTGNYYGTGGQHGNPYAITNAAGDTIIAWLRSANFQTNLVAQIAASADGAPQINGIVGQVMPDESGATALQSGGFVVADGAGGYIQAWGDYRHHPQKGDIFAQHYNASGVPQWAATGVLVSTDKHYADLKGIVADGAGGALITWNDFSALGSIESDAYVQRLDSNGSVHSGWPSGGLTVTDPTAGNTDVTGVTTDGAGGEIFTFELGGYVFANRVTAAGSVSWGTAGTQVSPTETTPGDSLSTIAADGSGGALIVWVKQDFNIGDPSIRGQRLDAGGTIHASWVSGGTLLTDEDTATNPRVVADGAGGLIAAWEEDPTFSDGNIKAQRLYSNSGIAWTLGGKSVTAATSYQYAIRMVSDDAAGAILAWTDDRAAQGDVYAQRIDFNGDPVWTVDGIGVAVGAQSKSSVTMNKDEAGGAVMSWTDNRNGDDDVFVQRLDPTGTELWTAGGLEAAARTGKAEITSASVSDGAGGLAVVFSSESADAGSIAQARIQLISDGAAPTNDATLSNTVTLSRLKVSTASDVIIAFTLQNTITGTLTVTFPSDFHILAAATSGTCSGGGTLGTFGYDDATRTLTAEKTACAGTVTMSGAKVINPSTPGQYHISWVNDDPGGGDVYIVDSDQVNISASVSASITFDIDTATTDTETGAPYSVSLGTLTTGAVNGSNESSVNSIWVDLDTNASGGAIVTVSSTNAALKSISVPGDTIPSADGTMAAGTANYGLCVKSVAQTTGALTKESGTYDGATCTATPAGNIVGNVTVSPQNILNTASNPVAVGRSEIMVNAAISNVTNAHNDYSDILKFIATGTF